MGLLRLLLAIAVVAAHAGPPGGWSWLRMTDGPTSVQCFYVISGFYMALILNEKYVGPGSYGAFAKSRLVRLLPMFFATLVATLVTAFVVRAAAGIELAPLATWREHGTQLGFGEWITLALPNLTIVGQDLLLFFAVDPAAHTIYFTSDMHAEPLPAWRFLWVPQAWTIGLELMFYSLAPLLVRRRLPVVLLLALASIGLRVWLMRNYRVGHDPWTYRFFPTELALFLAGAAAWRVWRWLGARGLLRPWAGRLATVTILGLVLAHQLMPSRWQSAPFGLPPLAAVVALLLPFVFEATKHSRLDRALGELSYPVYLLHYLWVMVAAGITAPWFVQHRGELVLVAVLGSALLLWHLVGRRFESVRQGFGARLTRPTDDDGTELGQGRPA
jgi:peptidoglycan/LPS O-acetylase OafA/YrhL